MYARKSQDELAELVDRHGVLVKRIAYHLVARLPPSVAVDDLIQAGMVGLIDAARQYDASQGAAFETYATIRVRGAMLDELRRNDWAPKSVHRRSRELAEAIRRVEAEHGREARDSEVAEALGISLDEYWQILQESSSCRMFSFSDMSDDSDGPEGVRNRADEGPGPEGETERDQFRDRLAGEIDRLPERERLVVALYYDEELNLKEIGAVLGVTESRISQILSQAHHRLRARLS